MVADKAGGGNTPKKGEQGFQKSTAGKKAPKAKTNKSTISVTQAIQDTGIEKQMKNAKDVIYNESIVLENVNPLFGTDVLSNESKLESKGDEKIGEQIHQACVDRDKIIKDLQMKNRSDFAKDNVEFDKFRIKNRAELEALLKENKGFRKIFKRRGLINTYHDFIYDYELSLNSKRRLTLENEETIIEQLYSNFMRTEEQYNGGKEPKPSSSDFSSNSWHDNSSQTSGNGSGSNGGSGGGGSY